MISSTAPDSFTASDQLTLRDLFGAACSRPLLFMFVFLAGISLTVFAWMVVPKKYGSEGRMYVQMGRNSLDLDSGNGPKSVTVMAVPENETRSVMEIIKSEGVLQKVAEEIGAEELLKGDIQLVPEFVTGLVSSLKPSPTTGGMSEGEYERQRELEQATRAIADNLTVYLEKNTAVISVYVKSNSALLSQRIVDSIMRITREQHLLVNSAGNSRDFFEEEYMRQSRELDRAIEEFANFRNENSFQSLELARGTLQAVIDRVTNQLLDVDVELAEKNSRLQSLKEALARIDEFLDAPAMGKERMSTEGARAQFFSLKNERAKLLSSYEEGHSKIREIDRQLETLRGELDRLPAERTETTAIINPTYDKTKSELVILEASLSGLKQRQAALLEKQKIAGIELEKLNGLELTNNQLKRNMDIAQSHLGIYSQKLGEAKIHDQLDKQAISAIVISQPAILRLKHASPKGSIFFPAGLMLSLFAGFLAAFVSSRRKQIRTRDRRSAEQMMDSEVLVSLPRVSTRRDMVR